jgi:hypothetical protein
MDWRPRLPHSEHRPGCMGDHGMLWKPFRFCALTSSSIASVVIDAQFIVARFIGIHVCDDPVELGGERVDPQFEVFKGRKWPPYEFNHRCRHFSGWIGGAGNHAGSIG